MAEARAYTYLGKTSEGYFRWNCRFTALTGDGYVQGTGIVLTFSGLANILGVEGIIGYGDLAAHIGNPVVLSGIATNVLTLVVLETAAVVSSPLDEKPSEAFGQAVDFYVTVFGL